MIRDAEHFSTKTSRIDGSGDLGEYIVNLVKSKTLPEKEAPFAPGKEEENKQNPEAEVMFDAADPMTPAEPSKSTSTAPEEEEKKTEPLPENTQTPAVATTNPPLPPTPEQMKEAERKKVGAGSGDSSPSTASEEAKLNGIEEGNEAMGKELPPTPMEVDEKDKMGQRSG